MRPLLSLTLTVLAGVLWLSLCSSSETGPAVGASRTASVPTERRTNRSAFTPTQGESATAGRPATEPAERARTHRGPVPPSPHERALRHQRQRYRELAAIPDPTPMQIHAMQQMGLASRFPPDNRLLTDPALDPVLQARESKLTVKKSEDGQRTLEIWCDRDAFAKGEPARIYARALPDSNRAGPPPSPHALIGTMAPPTGQALLPLVFEASENSVQVATVDTKPLETGAYKVSVHAGDGLSEQLVLSIYVPSIELSGRYRDRLEQGHLIIEAEVTVERDAVYLIRGSLYADAQTPVAAGEGARPLSVGTHWLPLRFHGRLFHETGLPGPYRLSHVQVTRRSLPASGGQDADPNHVTQPYPLEAFTAAPYNDLTAPSTVSKEEPEQPQ